MESYLCPAEDSVTEKVTDKQTNKQTSIYFRNIMWTLDKCVGRKCFWDGCQDWRLADNRGRLPGGGEQSVEGGQGAG